MQRFERCSPGCSRAPAARCADNARRRRAGGDPFVTLRFAADLRRRRPRAVRSVTSCACRSGAARCGLRGLAGTRRNPRRAAVSSRSSNGSRCRAPSTKPAFTWRGSSPNDTLHAGRGARGGRPGRCDPAHARLAAFGLCSGPESSSAIHTFPPRCLHLIWEELADDFELERLLRHPEARRAGDRAALLQHVQALAAERRPAARAPLDGSADARVPHPRRSNPATVAVNREEGAQHW